MSERLTIEQRSDVVWEIPRTGQMRVPGRIFASSRLMEIVEEDQAPLQVANVAHLPGSGGRANSAAWDREITSSKSRSSSAWSIQMQPTISASTREWWS